MSGKSMPPGLIAGTLLFHLLMFGFALSFVFVGLTDVLGSRASAITLLIGALIAIVVLHIACRQRSSNDLDAGHWLMSLGRAAVSYYLVIGVSGAGLLSAFPLAAAIVNLAEHGILHRALGNAILQSRAEHAGRQIIGLVWLGLQVFWVLPLIAFSTKPETATGFSRIRLIASVGLIAFGLSILAMGTIAILGPAKNLVTG